MAFDRYSINDYLSVLENKGWNEDEKRMAWPMADSISLLFYSNLRKVFFPFVFNLVYRGICIFSEIDNEMWVLDGNLNLNFSLRRWFEICEENKSWKLYFEIKLWFFSSILLAKFEKRGICAIF